MINSRSKEKSNNENTSEKTSVDDSVSQDSLQYTDEPNENIHNTTIKSSTPPLSPKQIALRDMPIEFAEFLSLFHIYNDPTVKDYHEFLSSVDINGKGFLLAARMEAFIKSKKEWDFKFENVRCSQKLCELRSFDRKSSYIAFELQWSGHFDEIKSIKGLRRDGTFNIHSSSHDMSMSVFSIDLDN